MLKRMGGAENANYFYHFLSFLREVMVGVSSSKIIDKKYHPKGEREDIFNLIICILCSCIINVY